MDLDLLYPGRFVKGSQLQGITKIEVVSASLVKMGEDDEKPKAHKPGDRPKPIERKAVLTVRMRDPFTGEVGLQEIVWCKVNSLLTDQIYGRDTNAWVGKVLFIHNDLRVRMMGKVGGIRVCGAPASVLPSPKKVTIRIKRQRGGDYVEEHTLLPNGGLTAPSKGATHAAPSDG